MPPIKTRRNQFSNWFSVTGSAWVPIGRDNDDMSVDMNANVNKFTNVLGETEVDITGNMRELSVDPYVIRKTEALSDFIRGIIMDNKVLSEVKCYIIDVDNTGDATTNVPATKWEAYCEVESYGGDTDAFQTPVIFHYAGIPVKGKVTISGFNTLTFTAT